MLSVTMNFISKIFQIVPEHHSIWFFTPLDWIITVLLPHQRFLIGFDIFL